MRRPNSSATCSKTSQYELWHANARRRRTLNHGVKAPLSGDPRYNVHANDIDFQIESDFIGMMTPACRRRPTPIADRVGRVMNYGDGLMAGCFSAACTPPHSSRATRARSSRCGLRIHSGGQRLWTDHPRRVALVRRESRRLDARPGTSFRTNGTETIRAQTARSTLQHRRASLNGAYRRARTSLRRRRFAKTLEVSARDGSGLRLQSVERCRDSWGHARLRPYS